MTDKTWTIVLWLLGLMYLGLGAWAAFSPASFTEELADFGTYNPHLIHDVATVLLTFGGALVIAAYLPSWRTPVLAVAALWNGLHAVSHLVDIEDAATPQMGVGVAALTVVTALGFAWLARLSARSPR
jgi:hypothetical protein